MGSVKGKVGKGSVQGCLSRNGFSWWWVGEEEEEEEEEEV
jgi:hypothetical protein